MELNISQQWLADHLETDEAHDFSAGDDSIAKLMRKFKAQGIDRSLKSCVSPEVGMPEGSISDAEWMENIAIPSLNTESM